MPSKEVFVCGAVKFEIIIGVGGTWLGGNEQGFKHDGTLIEDWT